MKDKKAPYFVAIATLIALYVFGVALVSAFWYNPGDEEAKTVCKANVSANAADVLGSSGSKIGEKKELHARGFPVRLIIPALNVNAKIQKVGITKKGNMAVPNNFVDVG